MGRSVLETTADNSDVTAYTHCSSLTAGDVMIAIVNRGSQNVTVDLGFPQAVLGRILVWRLSSDSLSSRNIYLNGVQLNALPGGVIPEMQPKVQAAPFEIGAYEIAFVSVSANASACLGTD